MAYKQLCNNWKRKRIQKTGTRNRSRTKRWAEQTYWYTQREQVMRHRCRTAGYHTQGQEANSLTGTQGKLFQNKASNISCHFRGRWLKSCRRSVQCPAVYSTCMAGFKGRSGASSDTVAAEQIPAPAAINNITWRQWVRPHWQAHLDEESFPHCPTI